jgi:hypothetical protein
MVVACRGPFGAALGAMPSTEIDPEGHVARLREDLEQIRGLPAAVGRSRPTLVTSESVAAAVQLCAAT